MMSNPLKMPDVIPIHTNMWPIREFHWRWFIVGRQSITTADNMDSR